MNSILSQDHYELLEVGRFASKAEIVKSYHRMKAAFDPDSVAVYSLFSPEETRTISDRIDVAFQVLMDERKKSAYDAWLQARDRGESPPEPVFARNVATDHAAAAVLSTFGTTDLKPFVPRRPPVLRPVPAGGFQGAAAHPGGRGGAGGEREVFAGASKPPEPNGTSGGGDDAAASRGDADGGSRSAHRVEDNGAEPPAAPIAAPSGIPKDPIPDGPVADETALRNLVASDRERDGEFYRIAREARGMTLRQVGEKTKINVMYLRFIEENNFRDLPAAVYLRGFLVQSGRLYGFEEPENVAEAYMALAERRKTESS